ncbi:MAG: hypothetical protein AAF849_02435 [Bacteroidota bacterium]
MKSILSLIMTTVFCSLQAQSPFKINYLSSKHEVVVVTYDGSLSSVADSDTTRLQPFRFLSIGRLKKATAISQGTIYTVFTYSSNQIIVIESIDENTTISDWKPVNNAKLTSYYSVIELPLKGRNRVSYSVELDNCKIHILNIKKGEIELFKWMATNVEFP